MHLSSSETDICSPPPSGRPGNRPCRRHKRETVTMSSRAMRPLSRASMMRSRVMILVTLAGSSFWRASFRRGQRRSPSPSAPQRRRLSPARRGGGGGGGQQQIHRAPAAGAASAKERKRFMAGPSKSKCFCEKDVEGRGLLYAAAGRYFFLRKSLHDAKIFQNFWPAWTGLYNFFRSRTRGEEGDGVSKAEEKRQREQLIRQVRRLTRASE